MGELNALGSGWGKSRVGWAELGAKEAAEEELNRGLGLGRAYFEVAELGGKEVAEEVGEYALG